METLDAAIDAAAAEGNSEVEKEMKRRYVRSLSSRMAL